MVFIQIYIFYNDIWKDAIYTDSSFPWIHTNISGWSYVIWFIETILVVGVHSAVVIVGLLADLL